MAEVNLNYNVDSLYRLAFPDLASKVMTRLDGVRDLALGKLDDALGQGFQVPPADDRPGPQLDFSRIQAIRLVQGEETSYLGTPIFQPIAFKGGTYQTLGSGPTQGTVVESAYSRWRLPATATAEFSREKLITTSQPSTARGTTKELWSFSDWEITIRGMILGEGPNYFPEHELRMLLRWERVVDAIAVEGDFFTYFGITNLVIERMNIGRIAGSPNVIPFQLSCVSDEPIELSIMEDVQQSPAASTQLQPGHVRIVATGSATPKIK